MASDEPGAVQPVQLEPILERWPLEPLAAAGARGSPIRWSRHTRTADAINWIFLSKLGGSKGLAFSLPFSNRAHVWRPSSAATEGTVAIMNQTHSLLSENHACA